MIEVAGIDPNRFVFLDETCVKVEMLPRYLRSKRGERAKISQRNYRGKRYTLLAGLNIKQPIAPFVIEGSMTKDVFIAYLTEFLVPELKPNQIIVMDNLSSHKSSMVKEIIEAAGAKLLYLPPYSPERNPIELAWSKLKTYLRKRKTKTEEGLYKAVRAGLNKINKRDCINWFAHCGHSQP